MLYVVPQLEIGATWERGTRLEMWMRVMGVVQGWASLGLSAPPQTYHSSAGGETCTRPTTPERSCTPWKSSVASFTFLLLSFCLPSPFLCVFSFLRGCSHDCHHITRPRLVIMDAGSLQPGFGANDFSSGGTGARFERAIIIVAGACALVASLVTFV